jgi:hypothetical protein
MAAAIAMEAWGVANQFHNPRLFAKIADNWTLLGLEG